MPSLVDLQTNERVNVSAAEARQGFTNGTHGLADEKIAVRDPETGAVSWAQPGDVQELLGEGFSFADEVEIRGARQEDEFTDVDSQIATAVEGVASGLTLGASDVLMQSGVLGEGVAEDSKKRAKHNPNLKLGFEVAGALAPALFTGGGTVAARGLLGTGKLVKTGRALSNLTPSGRLLKASTAVEAKFGTSLLGRTAGGAAAGAVESAAFETAREVTAALELDSEATAERVSLGDGFLNIARGAAFGGALGGAFNLGIGAVGGAVSAGANQLRSRFTKSADFKEMISDGLTSQAIASVKANKKSIRKLTRDGRDMDNLPEMGATMIEREIVPISGTITNQAGDVVNDGSLDGMLGAARRAQKEIGDEGSALVRQVDEQIAARAAITGKAEGVDTKGLSKRIEGVINDANLSPSLKAGLRKNAVLKDTLDAVDGDMNLQELWDLRKEMDAGINYESNAFSGAGERKVLQQVRNELSDHLKDEGDRLMLSLGDSNFAEPWQKFNLEYRHVSTAADTLNDAVLKGNVPRGTSLMDMAKLGSIGGAVGGLMQGDFDAAGGAAGAMVFGILSGRLSSFARKTAVDYVTGGALMKGTRGIANANASAKQILDEGIEGVLDRLRGKARGTATAARATQRRVAAQFDPASFGVDEINELMGEEPGASRDRFQASISGLRDVAPGYHAAVSNHRDRAVATLADEVTDPADQSDPLGHLKKKTLSAADKAGLERRVELTFNPASFFVRLNDGTLNREDVGIFREVYPGLYRDTVLGVKSELGNLEELPPYSERLQMGILFDEAYDTSTRAAFMVPTQQLAAVSIGFGINPPEQTPSVTPSNTKPVDLADGQQTRTQQVEDRS